MRSLAEAGKAWPQLDSFRSLTELKIAVSSHKDPLLTQGLRSVCWKIFLLFKTLDQSTWLTLLSDSRATYDSLRFQHLRAIKHPDEFESSIDPLSENQESPWVALRSDEALRAEIFQDIERCMPENVYFRQPATQDMMLDILFIFCKLNPDIGYRQGMHEILAPILWVIERDSVNRGAGKNTSNAHTDKGVLEELVDSCFIEHDSFTLYSLVMQTGKTFYAPGDSKPGAANESPMVIRSAYIFEKLLPRVDPKLSAHLVKLEILPQIFLLRWIRLLFGREFPLDEVLDMWDALFAIDPSLELVNTISIAMLLRIRWQLLEADTNMAFTLLLKYPQHDAPAYTFIKDALYLRDHLTPEGGVEIISRYSDKVPPIEKVQEQAPLPDRTRPSSSASSRNSLTQGGLESLLQGAAKGVFERGERWGVGKVIRDAVGEIKKNVDVLQSPGTPRAGGREFRKPARLATGLRSPIPQSSKSSSALEARNKGLAKMLQGAVAELWDYHKERSEGGGGSEAKDSIEALSTAIAKVQFVQVYLEDSSIPLPVEDPPLSAASSRPMSPPERTSSAPVLPTSSPSLPSSSRTPDTSSYPKRDISSSTTASNPLSPPQSSSTLSPRSRPTISQSSFSWMLGSEESKSSAFASLASHSAFPSDEKRRMKSPLGGGAGGAGGGKGYLFGEEDEGKGEQGEVEEEVIDLGPMGKGGGAVV